MGKQRAVRGRTILSVLAIEVIVAALLLTGNGWIGARERSDRPASALSLTSLKPAQASAAAGVWSALRAAGGSVDYEGYRGSPEAPHLRFATESGDVVASIRLGEVVSLTPRVVSLDDVARRIAAARRMSSHSGHLTTQPAVIQNPEQDGAWSAEFAFFWSDVVAEGGGDVCTVALYEGTQLVSEKEVDLGAPISEAARDGLFLAEMPDSEGVEPGALTARLQCDRFSGGFSPGSRPEVAENPPSGPQQNPYGREGTWVVPHLRWHGPAFDSYWDCTARVTRDGRLLGEGSVTVMQWQDGVGQMGIPVKLSEPAG
ncbi:MAG TPA: hypothetical protein VEU29_06900, partial [Actinomycetota bacterium]|nr:hypothetical protein [Actinomycetota bacterium]